MEYRAVKQRCAVDLEALQLPLTREKILSILATKRFRVMSIDLIALARECVGQSRYRRGARLSEAPMVVDCSSFVKWLYAQRGIWLPRRSIQQSQFGKAIKLEDAKAGDLIFTSGRIDYYDNNPAKGIGHVGIATNVGTVIHAANKIANVVESSLPKFVGQSDFRGARRYIPCDREVLTFEFPINREVEIADDIRWIILQSLR